MHAASVNPEPGSNSLKKLYIKYEAFASYLNIFSELLNSSFLFYFVMSISKFFNEIPSHFSVLLRNFFVVQFSMINAINSSLIYAYFEAELVLSEMRSIILSQQS